MATDEIRKRANKARSVLATIGRLGGSPEQIAREKGVIAACYIESAIVEHGPRISPQDRLHLLRALRAVGSDKPEK
jgi:hypothetical protein